MIKNPIVLILAVLIAYGVVGYFDYEAAKGAAEETGNAAQ
jgi:uncharacterized protein (UPF0333 family)